MAAAAQGMAGGASNFIGSLISLISKSDIRYQGFLAQIDAEQATIALEKVRSWGTEGRLVQQGRPSSEELPPNDNVYESIVFRAADVKDLKIDDPNPQRNAPAPPPQLPHDPAIMNNGAPPYGRPPPPGQGYAGPQFGAAPPPNVPYGAPGFPPYARPPPPQNLQPAQPASQSGSKPQQSPAPPVKAADKKDESSTDAVAEHLAKLNVAGSANLPKNGTNGKTDSAGPTNKANPNLPAIPRAAAAAAAAAGAQERHGSGGRNVPGSGGRQRGPQSSVFDNPLGRRGNGPVEVPDTDFDFDASNAKFAKQPKANGDEADKEEEGEEQIDVLSSIPPPSEGKSFYDKSSFFDSISNEVTERQEGQQIRQAPGEEQGHFGGRGGGRGGRGGGRGRADRLAEERRNMDTFGEVGSFGGGPRGRGRGRGRGGRGRGGRGRGDGFRGGRGGQAATFS